MTMTTKDFTLIADTICAQMALYDKDSNVDRYKYATLWETLRRLDAEFTAKYPNYNSNKWLAYCERKLGIATSRAATR